jgi:ATP-dependent helicase STH1/SNF2
LNQSAALEKLTQETAKFPRWKNFEQPEAADADAKAAATNATNSAVGTPQPPARSGFKLKLGGPKTPATSAAAKGDEE